MDRTVKKTWPRMKQRQGKKKKLFIKTLCEILSKEYKNKQVKNNNNEVKKKKKHELF